MTEPAIITIARECAQRPDDAFGATVVLPARSKGAWSALKVRPELLSENQNGDRVYRVSPKQARKILKVWEESLR